MDMDVFLQTIYLEIEDCIRCNDALSLSTLLPMLPYENKIKEWFYLALRIGAVQSARLLLVEKEYMSLIRDVFFIACTQGESNVVKIILREFPEYPVESVQTWALMVSKKRGFNHIVEILENYILK